MIIVFVSNFMTDATSHRLAHLPINTRCRIAKLGNISPSELKRLRDLGLFIGSVVSVITCAQSGPLLLSVGDTRIAINRDVAAEIKVVRIFE